MGLRGARRALAMGVIGGNSWSAVDLALPATNMLAWWYGGNGGSKPNEITATGDGALVSAWNDKSASAYHVAQTNAASKPTYRQSVVALNGRGAVEFDGNDYLFREIASGVAAGLSAYTVHIVFATASADAVSICYSEGSNTSSTPFVAFYVNRNNAGGIRYFHRTDAPVSIDIEPVGVGANDGAAHIITASFSTGRTPRATLRLDGVEIGTSNTDAGATTVTRLCLGAFFHGAATPDTNFTGQIATVAVYSGISNIAAVESALMDHY